MKPRPIDASHWTPERLDKHIDRSDGPNACHPWIGACAANGYGIASAGGRHVRAHRLAYKVMVGFADEANDVCHSCDNPPCCNERHLFEGDDSANMRDRAAKGRTNAVTGSRHHRAKLTEEQVAEIRAIFAAAPSRRGLAKALAPRYGVRAVTISRVAHGDYWKQVDAPTVPPGTPIVTTTCEVCGTVITTTPGVPRRYCSRPCFHRRPNQTTYPGAHPSLGESHNRAKLTAENVGAIRAAWDAAPGKRGVLSTLARRYDVLPTTIQRIVNRTNWKHIE